MFGIDNVILFLGIVIAVIVCITILILIIKNRQRAKEYSNVINLDPSRIPFRVRKIPAYTESDSSESDMAFSPTSKIKEMDCLEGKTNLSESLEALAAKYALEEITLATSDGLLLASSQKTPSTDAVARYAEMYAENMRPWPPGIILFSIEHKGSLLVGIAKTKDLLAQEPDRDFACETKDILNWWI
jgi:hypothetical protein